MYTHICVSQNGILPLNLVAKFLLRIFLILLGIEHEYTADA